MGTFKCSALHPVGMVYLGVIRKWTRCLLDALSYLHYDSSFSPLIHGHLQYLHRVNDPKMS